MQVERLAIPEVVLVTPRRFSDSRGFFAETWNRAMRPTRAGAISRRQPVRPAAPDEPDEDRWAAHARIRP